LAWLLVLNCLVPASQTLLIPDPRPLVERLGEEFFRQLPARPGVYLMQDATGLVLYVGKAKDLRQRLGHYRVANPDRMGRRHLRLLRQVVRIELQECPDEMAALAQEAELLRTLKPKFNRAGVWPATPRFLVWRRAKRTLDLAITETPVMGWQVFGPFGSGVIYLRSALVRLFWYALNPGSGSTTMPQGWLHGRLGAIVSIEADHSGVDLVLAKLFEGDTDGFVTWIGERTGSLAKGYELEIREGDLETVTRFMQAKARRTLPFHTQDPGGAAPRMDCDILLPFLDEGEGVP
jgi:predicted GIY-YIG superfamily endonuclease